MKMPFLASLLLLSCITAQAATSLAHLKVPSGFSISLFAEDITNAREMAISESGIVYVGSFRAGKVYALKDNDNNGVADQKWHLASDLKMPTGLAYKDGDLYVAAVNRILKFKNIEANLENPKYEVFFDDLPKETHHGWKFLRFAPNGDLIIPVGAPCNICEPPTDKHARIFSLNMKTKQLTELAKGVRNSVGFDFHPDSGELWFSDNGGDMMGDDIPPDEINRISKPGLHFGYPYYHAGDIADPQFTKAAKGAKNKKLEDYEPPMLKLGAHVAPLGIHFYLGKQFPQAYRKQLFVAEHGSWNRSKKSGYQVGMITLDKSKVVSYQPFVTGFMKDEKTLGRPAAISELADGSLLISDDYAHRIYRVSYKK
ncbi:MAG: glucose/arabinose dehydrogenase [Phenylobacterium sp.]|jgi:glucose/arabinose dehydrogenase